MEETENPHSVFDGCDDDIRILTDKIVKIIPWIDRAFDFISAAMDPYHDWFLFCKSLIRFPYTQIQAVFTLRVKCGEVEQPLVRAFAAVISFIYAVIRSNINWRFPAQLADRLTANIRNAFIGDDVLRFSADKSAIDTLYRQ